MGARAPARIIPVTDELSTRQVQYIGHLLREDHPNPTRTVTFLGEARPNHREKARVGGMRLSWTLQGMQKYWAQALPTHIRLTGDIRHRGQTFSHKSTEHRHLLAHMARSRFVKDHTD